MNSPINPQNLKIRSELGEFLAPRTGKIVNAWLDDVKSDARIPSADVLPERLLKDHIPKLLEVFITFLKEGMPAAKDAIAENSRQHGTERASEGYSIRELIWEIYRLRVVLLREIAEFAKGREQELADFAVACEAVDTYLHDLESRSVEKYAEEAKAAVKKSDGARLRLLRSISHELRNMLNSVGLATTMLEEGDAAAVDEIKENLERNCGHMGEVLDDLLELSDILSPYRKTNVGEFDVSTLIQSVDSKFRTRAEEKGLSFNATINGRLATLVGDAAKVEQVIQILVSNAIQYTHKGEVNLTLDDLSSNRWAIVVQDTGIGIAQKDREHIFSEFYQVPQESPLRGSGLGLAIAVGLVELLKGTIKLESEMGDGSTFRVELPKH